MQGRNWILTEKNMLNILSHFTRHCHKFTFIHCIKLWMDNTDIAQIVKPGLVGKKRSTQIYMFLFRQFLCLKIPFKQHVPFPSFTYRKMWTRISVKRLLLFCKKIDISCKPSNIWWLSVHLNYFAEDFFSFRTFFF